MATVPADERERAMAVRDVLDLAERIDRAKAVERHGHDEQADERHGHDERADERHGHDEQADERTPLH